MCPVQPNSVMRQRCRIAALRPALTLVLLMSGPGHAHSLGTADPTLAGWLRLETRLSVTPEILDTRWSSLVRGPCSTPDYSLSTAAASANWGPTIRAPSLIEISPPRPAAAEPQVYVRPQFALGVPSDSLRGWLRFAGLNASACTAPLMKMHSSFAGGSSHAKVSLSARCSIH